jgi:hypothetical protein
MTDDDRWRPDGASLPPPGEPQDGVPPRDPTGDRAWHQLVMGGLLLAAGVLWLLQATDVVELRWRLVLPAALIVVGLAVVAVSWRRPAGGLVAVGVVLTVLVVASTAAPVRLSARVGDRSERPSTVAELQRSYSLGMGQLTVDLRRLTLERDTTVEASVGVGELTVLVRPEVPLVVEASVAMGEVTAVDRVDSGLGVSMEERIPGTVEAPTLTLELSVGVGQVRVVRS